MSRLSDFTVGDRVVDDAGLVSGIRPPVEATVVEVYRSRMTVEYANGSREKVYPFFWRKVEGS